MKKKIVAIAIVAFLAGGGVVFAASNYYADMVTAQKNRISGELEEYYTSKFEERSGQQHNDLVLMVNTEVEDLKTRMYVYIDKKIHRDAQDRINAHSVEIKAAVEQLENELKQDIEGWGN